MTLEIALVMRDPLRKEVIVEFENMDKSLSVHIPMSEFKSWCKENDLEKTDENADAFARDYLEGVINTDDTAQLMLKEIAALFNIGKADIYTFHCEEDWYTLTQSKTGYRLYKGEKKQNNFLVKEVYKAVMRSIDKPINLN